MSLFGSLYIGNTGLNVSQTALNTTAHNLANVDTKGFVRQQVVLADRNYLKFGETYINSLQKGMGVNFAAVKQVRDYFLDQSYRQEIGRQAFYEAQYHTVGEIENFFGELEGVAFQNSINEFWISLQELAKEPDSIVTRETFIQTAVTFLERANTISNQLYDYQVNLNVQIRNQVNQINKIGDSIYDLNKKIRLYESSGVERANDLRDQRNLLLDELSKMVKVNYKEHVDGTVSVSVEDVPFVSDSMVYHMDTVKASETSEMLIPVWKAYGNEPVFYTKRLASSANNSDIGSLKGMLIARGTRQADYTDIPSEDRNDYATEEEYLEAISKYNIEINSSVIMNVQAQFDKLVHGIVTTINDILSPNREVEIDAAGTKVKILDVPEGVNPDDVIAEGLFNRISTPRYTKVNGLDIYENGVLKETITGKVLIYNEEEPGDDKKHTRFTLGEIEINPAILQDYSLISLSNNDGTGEFAKEKIDQLITAWKAPVHTLGPNSLTKYSFSEYYNAMISEMANRGEQLNTISLNQASMVESIDNQRMQITGVSSDDELTNLIKYQHAYNASARYINVINDMLEHIITRL